MVWSTGNASFKKKNSHQKRTCRLITTNAKRKSRGRVGWRGCNCISLCLKKPTKVWFKKLEVKSLCIAYRRLWIRIWFGKKGENCSYQELSLKWNNDSSTRARVNERTNYDALLRETCTLILHNVLCRRHLPSRLFGCFCFIPIPVKVYLQENNINSERDLQAIHVKKTSIQ